jgi:hypothetical protein
LRVETVGTGDSLTFGIVISRSVNEEEENRIEAWNGITGGEGPGGLLEEEANNS